MGQSWNIICAAYVLYGRPHGVSAMIKIFISNFQTKNLWEMRNFKKKLGRYPHRRGYYDVINRTCFSKIENCLVRVSHFCVFGHFRPISRPKSKKLMAYLLKIREIPTYWLNFQVDISKNDEVIDFWKKYFENFKKSCFFVKSDDRNVRFFGNGRW